jgi:hypothetical protein
VMTLLPAIISTTIINAFFGFYNFGPQLASQKASNPPNLLYQSCGSFVSITIMMYCQMCECSDSVLPDLSLLFSCFLFPWEKDFSVLSKSMMAPVRGKSCVPFGQPQLLGRVSC